MHKFLETLNTIESIARLLRHKIKTAHALNKSNKIPIEALHEAESIMESLSRMMVFLHERRDALASRPRRKD